MTRIWTRWGRYTRNGGMLVALLLLAERVPVPTLAKDEPPSGRSATRKSIAADVAGGGAPQRVVVVHPKLGGIPRISEQAGTMESYDFADLYAKISGYVKKQTVDIGSQVAEGDVLAEIDAPELDEALNEASAAVTQAEAQVSQMEARVKTAIAELDAAEANVTLAEADLARADSYLSFRELQYERIKKLFELKSIDERLVDEKHEQRDSAKAAANSARAAIAAAKSQAAAAKARIISAEADVLEAQAKVKLARSREAKARVFVSYTRIISPYQGVVTRRSFHVGDFIRSAESGGGVPLLTVARTDLMRVIVQVPERDVPFADVGDVVTVHYNSTEGDKFAGVLARISNSEDRTTRTMRAEVDLPNPHGRLRDGMFCRVAITLGNSVKSVQVPSSSVVADRTTKSRFVYVVSDGLAHRRPVEIGQDDGKTVEVVAGLSPRDLVVERPSRDLDEGGAVEIEASPTKP
jgi:HlyD family secretion protein